MRPFWDMDIESIITCLCHDRIPIVKPKYWNNEHKEKSFKKCKIPTSKQKQVSCTSASLKLVFEYNRVNKLILSLTTKTVKHMIVLSIYNANALLLCVVSSSLCAWIDVWAKSVCPFEAIKL